MFLTREEYEGHSSPRVSTRPVISRDLSDRGENGFADDEEAQQDIEVQEPLNRYNQVRQVVYNKLYAALAPVVCVLSIASTIGCVILANYSNQPVDGVFIG